MYINYTYNCADLHAVTYVGCGWRSRPKENWGWCLVSFLIALWSVWNQNARNSAGMTPGCEAGWLRLASAGGASLIDHGSRKAKGNDAESKNGNFWAVGNRLLVELLARARIWNPPMYVRRFGQYVLSVFFCERQRGAAMGGREAKST